MRLERPGLPLHGPDRKLDLPVYLQLHDHLAGMFLDALLPYLELPCTHYTDCTTLHYLVLPAQSLDPSILFYSITFPIHYTTLTTLPYLYTTFTSPYTRYTLLPSIPLNPLIHPISLPSPSLYLILTSISILISLLLILTPSPPNQL